MPLEGIYYSHYPLVPLPFYKHQEGDWALARAFSCGRNLDHIYRNKFKDALLLSQTPTPHPFQLPHPSLYWPSPLQCLLRIIHELWAYV